MNPKKTLPYTLAAVLTIFGLITLFLSSSVIFDLFGIREKEGNYVLFVVIANFIGSILYLVSAFGIIKFKLWTTKVLGLSFIVLLLAFTGLLLHINSGGVYETKTVGAMVFRLSLTLLFVGSSYFLNKPMKNKIQGNKNL